MRRRVLVMVAVAGSWVLSALAQGPGYPITVVPPGKGPYQFPQGYQTPWDKIEMVVTEKLAPNLYSLHGSAALDPAHPDAAGGRVAVLFGSDGVLLKQFDLADLASNGEFVLPPAADLIDGSPEQPLNEAGKRLHGRFGTSLQQLFLVVVHLDFGGFMQARTKATPKVVR